MKNHSPRYFPFLNSFRQGAMTFNLILLLILSGLPTAFAAEDTEDKHNGEGVVTHVEVKAAHGTMYKGTVLDHYADVFRTNDIIDFDAKVTWSTSDSDIATVDRFGNVKARSNGDVTVFAEAEGVRGSIEYTISKLPADGIEIIAPTDEARTGDVLNFDVRLVDNQGSSIENLDASVSWSARYTPAPKEDHSYRQNEAVGTHTGASALIDDKGRFVGEKKGQYTIVANVGDLSDQVTVKLEARNMIHEVTKLGQGRVNDKHTSDFWVYEGKDGRNYAITGTWGAAGYAYFWDVNDSEDIVKIDSIQVDARTINDVKVSPDSRYAVLSREGASDRRNGVIIVNLEDPQNPKIASTYDEGLTGGVHNVFPTNDHLFALSAGEKFVILDVTDIENPKYVSEYSYHEEDARIHDVHVKDGIAYASQWQYGTVIVDVGNGRWGGTIEEPEFVTNIEAPGGRIHATFPYYSESADRFYLFQGDEVLQRRQRSLGAGGSRTLHVQPFDLETGEGGRPSHSDGYIHIVDWTDFEDPETVARYHVPEYGTHNMWVKNDVLYQAYYEGGARMVDVSGKLKGNLATQGREMAVFKSFDPDGYIKNAPMVWTVYPFDDKIWFSDWNSGLWVLEKKPLD